MGKDFKIVFLIIDYVPHQVNSISSFIELYDANILSFNVGRFIKKVPLFKNFTNFYYKDLKKEDILEKIIIFQPDIVVTAGWMIPEYNWICKHLKKRSAIPIVAMSDTPWYGTWKQKINTAIAPFHIKKAFTHLWVAGIRQYDYARKLGFTNQKILFNSLSANINNFYKVSIVEKRKDYPRNFLFIGTFLPVKGLENLIAAWSSIEDKKGWSFTVVGEGLLREKLLTADFIVKNFMSQEELVLQLQTAGCFVLPSLKETWAIVIHEAAAAGLPILCTETCGAASHFVISNYNGYHIKDNSVMDLKMKLEKIINMDNTELIKFSERSRGLSNVISPEIHVASLMQLLNA
ncbi:glycosyltransferase [Chryseobacterium lacus]|uniref:Glycosyltransferase n=1 Tax=Chryseobacterium lacus TaxID=2058346 RepID=A0A368MZA3_9FLAO|nr:glycosyltransferase [Chryseobacterium lacus]RCU42601.1 glycosyltransferase [Chryseobacterium lacus]RST27156.1 glycosyltransferase [Chryseobacterium lacus]